MCNSDKRSLGKPLELIVQVIVFRVGLYLVSVIAKHDAFSTKEIVDRVIPSNYFVILYVTLYFISPLINWAIRTAEEKRVLKRVVGIAFLTFSVYPTMVDVLIELTGNSWTGLSSVGMYGSQWGYSIVNFSLMYLIGADLHKSKSATTVVRHVVNVALMAIMLVIWARVNDVIGFGTERSAWEYCNPILIMIAVEVFRLFEAWHIGTHKWINTLAKASFTVFLLHSYFLKYLHIEAVASGNTVLMLLHILVSVVAIYLVCAAVWLCYETVTRPIYRWLYSRCEFLTQDVVTASHV